MTRAIKWSVVSIAAFVFVAGCANMAGNSAAPKKAAPEFKPTDVVLLKDGSRLVGEIQQLSGGKMLLKTAYSGVLILDMAKVEKIATDRMLNVRIKDGDSVVASLRHGEEKGQELRTKDFGARGVSLEEIDTMWALGHEDPKDVAHSKALEAQRPKWSFRTEFGLTGQTGNSERISSYSRTELKRNTPTDRSLLYFQGRYSRENGLDSEKEFLGGGKQEVDITKKTFVWGRAEFENDTFEDISLRSTVTAGVGRFIIREDDHELKFRAGGGFLHESYKSGGTDGRVIAELAVDYMKVVSEWMRYTHNTTYTPSLQDIDDYRITMENALEFPLNKLKTWKIRMGIRNEYTAIPSPSADRRMDTMYFANFVWELN